MAGPTITQPQAVGWEGLGARERVAFWRAPHLDGLDGLAARFTTHRYAPHTHETWVMGVVTAGAEVFACRGARHRAAPGQVCVVPPGEVHDGEPERDGYEYRMLYPSARLVDELARELAERPGASRGTPGFAGVVLDDPDLAALFVAAHEHLSGAPDGLGGEELLSVAVAALLRRHARFDAPDAGAGPGRPERAAVARARAVIEARYAEPLRLPELAAEAGLTRFRLIRAFKREFGITPHLYLLDRRVRAAGTLLRAGHPPAEAAVLAGFSDQSHLTRAFKARLGVTPAVFRRGGR